MEETFYGPPYDFRPTPEWLLWWNYNTNPFIDLHEKVELGQWLNGLPPTYGEWWYQYAERIGLENEGATTQPNPEDDIKWTKWLNVGTGLLALALVLYGLRLLSQMKK